MIDLDAILDQAARRARALQGSHHANHQHRRSWEGPRADAESELDRPELLWPAQRRQVPARCHQCGAGRAMFDVDAPYGLRTRGDVTCLACTRVIVRLRADWTRRVRP